MRPPRSNSTADAALGALAAAAIALGAWGAWRAAWLCDDAFISFRYADNLVRGLGLVFNAGERVEGYSNLAWTLWIALGLKLGVAPEAWAIGWGIAAFAGTIALLAWRTARRVGAANAAAASLPLAALALAVHPDAVAFATSGLETSAFTLLVLLGFVFVVEADERAGWLAAAGAAFGLAAITRPDGALLACTALAFVALASPRRLRAAACFGAPLLACIGGQLLWRIGYYHDLLPNTYYAKSAGRAWVQQGALYVGLYALRYPLIALGAALGVWGMRTPAARVGDAPSREAALAATLLGVWLAYVLFVGGDFMFARWLVPVTPLALVLGERAFERWRSPRPALRWAVAAALVAITFAMPSPVRGTHEVAGIVDERAQYPPERCDALRRKGETLRRCFDGVPVTVAFMGGEARVVYYSRVGTAIECATGLTDRFIAHQPLGARGRVGHEKHPSAAYVMRVRGVQLGLHPGLARELAFGDSALDVPIRLAGTRLTLMRRDPALLEALATRGLRTPWTGAQTALASTLAPATP